MALSGDHVIVKMDDSSSTLRTFADGDIRSIDLGLTYDQFDVTGFGDEVHQYINGQLRAPAPRCRPPAPPARPGSQPRRPPG